MSKRGVIRKSRVVNVYIRKDRFQIRILNFTSRNLKQKRANKFAKNKKITKTRMEINDGDGK